MSLPIANILIVILAPFVIYWNLREKPRRSGALAQHYRAEPKLFLARQMFITSVVVSGFANSAGKLLVEYGWIDEVLRAAVNDQLLGVLSIALGLIALIFGALYVRASGKLGQAAK